MARQDDMPRGNDPTELEPRPRQPGPPGTHATMAQLRQDIDSGATGDKVAVLDPAAAPLGTDDEAAGDQPAGAAVAKLRRTERHPPARRMPPRSTTLFVALVALMALIVAWLAAI